MQNKYFITNMVSRLNKGIFTYFLDEKEQKEIISILNKNKMKYSIYYPYKESSKVILYSKIKPKVSLMEIDGNNLIKHKDILGSLYALGIKPYMYGDIIISDKKYIIILNEIEEFLQNNLTKIGKYNVKVIKTNINILANYQKEFIEKIVVLKSIRLDSLLSKLINKSREDVKKIIHSKLVILNYELVSKNHINLCEGDIISIRGYGKYKISKIEKNKNIKITVLKY